MLSENTHVMPIEAGSCEAQVCTPGTSLCVGDTLLTCSARGTRFESEACPGGCSERKGAHCLAQASGGASSAGGTSGAGGKGGTSGNGGQGGTSGNGAMPAVAGAGGEASAACSAAETPDNVTVPDCGYVGNQSAQAYQGVVSITVSGIVLNAPGEAEDAFYSLDPRDNAQALSTCSGCLVFNRASEGECVCQLECRGKSHRLSDFIVGPYPAFNPEHSYTLRVDLGAAPAQPLNFAFGDCGCGDNSGSYALSIACAPW